MAFTKNQAKLIKSLHDKKHRNELGLFLVEGEKNVLELFNSDWNIDYLLCTADFFDKNRNLIKDKNVGYDVVEHSEIEKVGTLESNDSVLAIVKQKENNKFEVDKNEILIALDEIKDPGNLGTIIRIADWYGITKIIASENTVDFYNPKVISATKGSFLRINISYANLAETLPKIGLPIFGTFMSGENVHTFNFPKSGILLMGNESNGISKDLENIVTQKITIPSFGKAESLNVAIATSVILDNWKRSTK
ncbi:MAG: RNA methyltransferase [Minisyncoccia bacterium]